MPAGARPSRWWPSSTARPTDNNATLFAQGYNSVLEPALRRRQLHQGPEPVRAGLGQPARPARTSSRCSPRPGTSTGCWWPTTAWPRRSIAVLKQHHLNGKVQVTGQDATVPGLQTILAGDQCMTVFKASQAGGRRGRRAGHRPGQRPDAERAATTIGRHGHARREVGAADAGGDHEGEHQADVDQADGLPKRSVCTATYRRGLHDGRLGRHRTAGRAPTPASSP